MIFSILHLLVATIKTEQFKQPLVSEKLKKFVLKSEAKNFIFVAARIPGMKPGLKLG